MGYLPFSGLFFQGYRGTMALKKKVKKGKNIAFVQPSEPLGSSSWLIYGVQGHEKAEKAQQGSEKHNT